MKQFIIFPASTSGAPQSFFFYLRNNTPFKQTLTCRIGGIPLYPGTLSYTHLSSFSRPTVTSQPGNTLAARTGEMQQRPMGLPSTWNACSAALTSSLTEQSFPCTAHVQRFFAAPKPPTRHCKKYEINSYNNHLDTSVELKLGE